jgi:hypothetical protein
MKTVSKRIDPWTHKLVADRVEASLEPGRLMAILEDQTHKILARTLNQALENELSEALGVSLLSGVPEADTATVPSL